MDENGLELSLGLSFGGSLGKLKDKVGTSDLGAEEDDRGNTSVSDFRGLLDAGKNKLDSIRVLQDDGVKPQENFFSDLSKGNAGTDDEVSIEGSNKRKTLFDEFSHQKKHPRESKHSESPDKSGVSHITINTDGDSVADNEDVAGSEAGGSTSKLVPHHNMKGVRDYNEVGNYGVPFSVQEINITAGSQPVSLRDSSSLIAPGRLLYPSSIMRHPLSGAENEQPGITTMALGNGPVISGYSPVQLPVMDKDNSRVVAPHAALGSKGPPTSAPVNPSSSSEDSQRGRTGRTAEMARAFGKQHPSEEGSLNPAELDAKTAASDNLFSEHTAIKPGMATEFKFGGCGSFPNLPWVSTTGPGPNGKTISGVSYMYSTNQVRIVCACHGSHLSPEAFVQHASEDKSGLENGTATLPAAVQNNNPSTSAHVLMGRPAM
ncbi:hypothetical protein MLD38_014775 [Melastoma candidum]|uniref:Uncharacterized protein n=1 Tax=Melastoma candidum TaxID=119954 RepID=A0ACB9RHK3_9MYRT|nr:hypothetical protein MLD38_014775 [Melastoma candidum]